MNAGGQRSRIAESCILECVNIHGFESQEYFLLKMKLRIYKRAPGNVAAQLKTPRGNAFLTDKQKQEAALTGCLPLIQNICGDF